MSKSEWTVATLKEHLDALRSADQRALQIKETADERALLLQAETQKYKDEKANDLRSQIESERGTYATQRDLQAAFEKLEEQIKPLTQAQGRESGALDARSRLLAGLVGLAAIAAVVSPHVH